MVAGQVTKAATENNEKFPFVTVELFEVIGSQARRMSGVDELMWSPMVDIEEYAAWTNYSTEHIGWLNESIALYLAENGNNLTLDNYDLSDTDYAISSPIPGLPTSAGPWAPIWQISPPPVASYIINFDMYAFGAKILDDAVEKFRTGLISEVIATPGQENVPPSCVVVHPVYERLFDQDTAEIVGHLYSKFPWDAYLVNLLPKGVTGINAVLKNSCGQHFSYALEGTSVRIQSWITVPVTKFSKTLTSALTHTLSLCF